MGFGFARLAGPSALLLLVNGCGGVQPTTASSVATPATSAVRASTLPRGTNGAIESLSPIRRTATAEYYELVYWSDGLRVTGFLGRPTQDRPRAAVIYNRGGNREFGKLEGREIVPLVEAGFVAVASQYRGNAGGEGREEFGGADVNDVLNLVVLLRGLPDVNPERIGMMGHSRGGMMTYLSLKQDTLARTRHIKAAVTIGGLADLFMWSSERPDVVRGVYRPLIGPTPDAAPELYRARSATHWPELIDVPLLILHGEADWRVSVDQARKLARALTQAKKRVELVTYPGGDHGLSGHSRGYDQAVSWFQRYLGTP